MVHLLGSPARRRELTLTYDLSRMHSEGDVILFQRYIFQGKCSRLCIHTTVLHVYCTRGVHYTVPLFAFSFTVYAYSISTTYHARCTVGRETNRRFEFQLARGFRRFTPCSRVYSCEKVHTAYREHTGSVLSADCAVWRTGVRPPRAPHTYAAFRPSCHRSPSRGCEGRGPRALFRVVGRRVHG